MPRKGQEPRQPTRSSARIRNLMGGSNDPGPSTPRNPPAVTKKGRPTGKSIKKDRDVQSEVEYADSHPRSTRNGKAPVAGRSSRLVPQETVESEEDPGTESGEDPGSGFDEDPGSESEEEPLQDPDAYRSRGPRGRKPATVDKSRRRSSGYDSDAAGRTDRRGNKPVVGRGGGNVEASPPATRESEEFFTSGLDRPPNSRKRQRGPEGGAIDRGHLSVPQTFQGVGFAPQDIDKNSVEPPDEGYESEEIGVVLPVGQMHKAELKGPKQLLQFDKGPGGFFGVYRYGPQSHGFHSLERLGHSMEKLPADLQAEVKEAQRGGGFSRYSKHWSVENWPQKPPPGSIGRIPAIAVYSDGILKKLLRDYPGDYDHLSALDAWAWSEYQAPLMKILVEWAWSGAMYPATWEWRTTVRKYMYPGDTKRTFSAEISVQYKGRELLAKGDLIFMADQTIIYNAVRMEKRYDRWKAGEVKDAGDRAPSFSPIPPLNRYSRP